MWIFNEGVLSILSSIVSKEAMQVAYFHLFFNCFTALITTPLIEYLVKIACFVVKDKKKDDLVENLINNVGKLEISPGDTQNEDNLKEEKVEKEKQTKENNEEKKEEKDIKIEVKENEEKNRVGEQDNKKDE